MTLRKRGQGATQSHTQHTVIVSLQYLGDHGPDEYGVEPPGLIKLEKEIEQEETLSVPPPSPSPISTKSPGKKSTGKLLDEAVKRISEDPPCKCPNTFCLERLSQGRYKVGEKILFIRMLHNKHVMVRVGGGWETFAGYLLKHDPCRILQISRVDGKISPMQNKSPSIKDINSDNYLVVSANYKTKKEGPKWPAWSSLGPDSRPPPGLQLRSHLAVGAQLPPGASPHPLTQPTAYRARARGTQEPAAPCASQPMAPAQHSRVRTPRVRRPRIPRGRREPPMSPGSQASLRGTSSRPVPHPSSKFRA
ncbi:hypothetical protein NDU88_007254 [Pleurodeles waltl]|uniref:GAR domain-containing protein n=1 Tax=Pleurodeles waltl TaxID=8319 RepID=A0AAV7TZJ4_PLEWA|nr:hypothetical protein NDU88_007254 [Pleurodeles waltl]